MHSQKALAGRRAHPAGAAEWVDGSGLSPVLKQLPVSPTLLGFQEKLREELVDCPSGYRLSNSLWRYFRLSPTGRFKGDSREDTEHAGEIIFIE